MIMKFDYLDNKIIINKEYVHTIEIENKKMLCRILSDIYLTETNNSNNLHFYDDEYNEINVSKNIKIVSDYFKIEDYLKKYTNDFIKLLLQSLEDKELNEMNILYKKNIKLLEKLIIHNDLPLEIEEQTFDALLKGIKIKIKNYDNLLDNLFLIVNIEKILNNNNILIFVGLNQYFTKEELKEFYKYVVYNEQKVVIINYKTEGLSSKFEKKLIIDENLEEFMV